MWGWGFGPDAWGWQKFENIEPQSRKQKQLNRYVRILNPYNTCLVPSLCKTHIRTDPKAWIQPPLLFNSWVTLILYTYYIYMYIWYPPQSPRLSCSGNTSNVNSTPCPGFASRIDVVTERNLDLYFQDSKFPKSFRANLEPAQYDYWTRGSDRWLKCAEPFASFAKFPKRKALSHRIPLFAKRAPLCFQNSKIFQKFKNLQKGHPYVSKISKKSKISRICKEFEKFVKIPKSPKFLFSKHWKNFQNFQKFQNSKNSTISRSYPLYFPKSCTLGLEILQISETLEISEILGMFGISEILENCRKSLRNTGRSYVCCTKAHTPKTLLSCKVWNLFHKQILRTLHVHVTHSSHNDAATESSRMMLQPKALGARPAVRGD